MALPKLNICFLGHVDSGKSTIAGHLMVKKGGVDAHLLDKYETEAEAIGKGSFKFAWVTDKLKEEREKGISIDATLCRFDSPKHDVTVIDAPGHRHFIKNAITGVAQADSAVLVVSAATGELEANLSASGQAREHTLLANTLGVKRLIVAVNKMDLASPPFSQARFDEVKKKVSVLVKACGYSPKATTFVPVSGWGGDNLDDKSGKMAWYTGWTAENKQGSFTGTTLLDAIDSCAPPKRADDSALRIPIQHVYNVKGVGVVPTGRVESGTVKVGQTVTFGPGRNTAEVVSLEVHHKSVKTASAGDVIGFNVTNVTGGSPIAAGMVCGDPELDPPRGCESFVAHVVVLNHPGEITPGYTPTIDCHTAHAQCKFVEFVARLDRKGQEVEKNPRSLKAGESALVRMVPMSPLVVDPYATHPSTGRFAVRDLNTVIAVGMVKSVVKADKPPKMPKLTAALAALD